MAHATQIAAHIRERIAKSKIVSPPVHLSREAWELILDLLDQEADKVWDYDADLNDALDDGQR